MQPQSAGPAAGFSSWANPEATGCAACLECCRLACLCALRAASGNEQDTVQHTCGHQFLGSPCGNQVGHPALLHLLLQAHVLPRAVSSQVKQASLRAHQHRPLRTALMCVWLPDRFSMLCCSLT